MKKYFIISLLLGYFCIQSFAQVNTTSLSEALKNAEDIKMLKLKPEDINKFLKKSASFKNLEALDISNCNLAELPPEVLNLPKLKDLNVANNKISQLPASLVGNLDSLQNFNLAGNQLTSLPEGLIKKFEEKSLQLRDNLIPNLQFGEKELSQLPLYTNLNEALKNPDKVVRLSISNFKEVPIEDLKKFKNLQDLSLNNSYLKELPTDIGDLKNLQDLSLINNNIKELPASLGKLSQLKSLNTSLNPLEKLPESIGELTQ